MKIASLVKDFPRVRLTATDVQSGKSKTITLEETTPHDVIEFVKSAVADVRPTPEAIGDSHIGGNLSVVG